MKLNTKTRNVFIFAVIALFFAAFLIINYRDKIVGVSYAVLAAIAIIIYANSKKILGVGEKNLLGIELFDRSDWKQDILIGAGLGIGFIIANSLSSAITIGIPSRPMGLSDSTWFLVVVLLAPILEELVFRGVALGIMRGYGMKFGMAAILSSIAFMLFHLTAYGASMTASGAFVGAFIFGLVTCYLVRWRNSLLPGMILHAIFNAYLLSKMVMIIP